MMNEPLLLVTDELIHLMSLDECAHVQYLIIQSTMDYPTNIYNTNTHVNMLISYDNNNDAIDVHTVIGSDIGRV